MTDDDTLQRLAGRLPRSIEPQHDLWPAIEMRMSSRRPRRRVLALAAAAVVAVAAASSLTTAWLLRDDAPPTAFASSPLDLREAAYLRTAAALAEELALRRQELSPETVEVLERNLAIIDRAIAESRAALAGDPTNDDLAALLWASYQRKVSLLEQAASIATPS